MALPVTKIDSLKIYSDMSRSKLRNIKLPTVHCTVPPIQPQTHPLKTLKQINRCLMSTSLLTCFHNMNLLLGLLPTRLHSLVGRAPPQYHGGHGFKSQIFFWAFFATASVANCFSCFTTANITFTSIEVC